MREALTIWTALPVYHNAGHKLTRVLMRPSSERSGRPSSIVPYTCICEGFSSAYIRVRKQMGDRPAGLEERANIADVGTDSHGCMDHGRNILRVRCLMGLKCFLFPVTRVILFSVAVAAIIASPARRPDASEYSST